MTRAPRRRYSLRVKPLRTLGAALAIAVGVTLSGCITIVQAPPIDSGTEHPDCVAEARSGVQEFDVCGELLVDGNDIEVRVSEVDVLVVRGDRNRVELRGGVGLVTITETDNQVDITSGAGELDIAGERNRVDVQGGVGLVTIADSENRIDVVGGLGELTISGQRHEAVVRGGIGLVTLAGSDHVVESPDGYGSVVNEGERNDVRT